MTAMEPDYLEQKGDVKSMIDGESWVDAQWEEATKMGCTCMRISIHPDINNVWLVEGWNEKPKEEGPPRFRMN